MPMDAVVIIDCNARKRLFYPIGLASKGARSEPLSLANLVEVTSLSLEYLQSEKQKALLET